MYVSKTSNKVHENSQTHDSLERDCIVGKGAKIRNRYNQEPHPTQITNGKVTNSQLDTTNESQEVRPFPADDHQAHINRRAQRHSKPKTEKCNMQIHSLWNKYQSLLDNPRILLFRRMAKIFNKDVEK